MGLFGSIGGGLKAAFGGASPKRPIPAPPPAPGIGPSAPPVPPMNPSGDDGMMHDMVMRQPHVMPNRPMVNNNWKDMISQMGQIGQSSEGPGGMDGRAVGIGPSLIQQQPTPPQGPPPAMTQMSPVPNMGMMKPSQQMDRGRMLMQQRGMMNRGIGPRGPVGPMMSR